MNKTALISSQDTILLTLFLLSLDAIHTIQYIMQLLTKCKIEKVDHNNCSNQNIIEFPFIHDQFEQFN